MNIDSIENGIVIDHITAGKAMKLYELLNLGELDAQVAIIKNATSHKMGKKDIIKIDADIDVDIDAIGYVDPAATVSIIRDGKLAEKVKLDLPPRLVNIIKCRNPRCITSTEQEIDHVFKLVESEHRIYRCIYCESKAKKL